MRASTALIFFSRLALSPPRCGGVGARLPPLAKKISPTPRALVIKQKFRKTRVLRQYFADVLRAARRGVRTRALRAWTLRLPAAASNYCAKRVFCGNFCTRRGRQQTRTLNLIRLRGAAVSSSRPPFVCCPRLLLRRIACRRNKLKPQAVFFRSRRFSRRFWPVLILAGFGDSGRFWRFCDSHKVDRKSANQGV